MKISGHILDVLNERMFDGEILVEGDRIVSVAEVAVPEGSGYIMPGFIDAHMHVESTLALPEHYADLAVRRGVVGAVTDPHEIANVLGRKGTEFMIDNAAKVRFHFAVAASPCVPSTCFETAGATLTVNDIKELLTRDEVYGLGEMMNVPGVLFSDPEVMAKIEAAVSCGKVIDGHAPGAGGDDLKRYIAAGISTDHECETVDQARERIALGAKVAVREGSAARNFDALMPLLAEPSGQLMFCSDDIYPDELLYDGYLDVMVRRSINAGMPLWNVLRAASVTPVEHYSLPCGLLRAGDSADFIVVDNLQDFNIKATYISGEKVYDAATGTQDVLYRDRSELTVLPNQFNAVPVSEDDIRVSKEGDRMKVIVAEDGSLLTDMAIVTPVVEDGNVISDPSEDVLKLVVYNRYTPSRPSVAFIRGFSLKKGAMASTIAHDSHNIVALGVTDSDIATAINALIRCKGGIFVGDADENALLPLPVAGLISPWKGEDIAEKLIELKRLAKRNGCCFKAPFMTMAFMALPVIPAIKLTDKGLFDYSTFNFTSLFEG